MITEIISKVQVHQRILMKKFQICKYKIQKISKKKVNKFYPFPDCKNQIFSTTKTRI